MSDFYNLKTRDSPEKMSNIRNTKIDLQNHVSNIRNF